ncbi:hypothetical protein ACFLX0_03740 [Chloroflexota bacterium]
MAVLLLSLLYAVFGVFTVSIDLSSLHNLSGQAMPQGVRLMTPFFNTFGTIALDATLPAFGGTLMRFGGSLSAFYLLELLGIIISFTGFLRSREVFGFYRFPLIHGFGRVIPDSRD